MTDLQSFLKQLQALPAVKVLLFEDIISGTEKIAAEEELVFVGCGSWDHPGIVNTASPPLLLNNKGAKRRFGYPSDYSSLAMMLAEQAPDVFEDWCLWREGCWKSDDGLGLSQIVARVTIVAEDASPDSLFSYVQFLAAISGIEADRLFRPWIEAVDEWERYGNSTDPALSWCALESALVHRRFPVHGRLTGELMSTAWNEALHFLAASLAESGLHPDQLPAKPYCLEHALAQAALQQEENAYQQWLQHATIVQVSLPLVSISDRRLIVDALFIDEEQMMGSAKVFYRNDKINSPLKKGFAFAVHYRPNSTESKVDVTISVDPRRGVSLRELHNALEALETAAWNDGVIERPRLHPRYMENVPNTFDEPWYMDRNYTLIGAPRRLPNGEYGSRLTRDKIEEAVWRSCNPINGVFVRPATEGSVPQDILKIKMENLEGLETDKVLRMAAWPSAMESGFLRSLPDAPTVWRILAALTMSKDGAHLPELKTLPSTGDYDRINLSGGVAIVTESGAFVLDDWTAEEVGLGHIRDAFFNAAKLDGHLVSFEDDVKKIVGSLANHFEKPLRLKRLQRLIRKTARLSTHITQIRGSHALLHTEANARAFRASLGERWALDARFDALDKTVLSVQTALRSLLDIGTASTTRFIATFGFSAGLGAGLASPLAKWLSTRMHWQPANQDAPGGLILGTFLILTTLCYALLSARFGLANLLGEATGEDV